MSLFNKYVEAFREAEKTISGLSFVPRGMVKILMSLKVLTNIIGVLILLANIVSFRVLVGKTIL